MSNKTHLEFIYNRLVNVYGENELYDYMIKFKESIEEINLKEAYLLDAVTKLVTLKIEPLHLELLKTLSKNDFKMTEEVKFMADSIKEYENALYNNYGIVKHTSGKIE